MATFEITPKTLETANIALPLVAKVFDIFRPEGALRVEWTAPNFKRTIVCWGLWVVERGERRSFIIRGKPGFCAAVLANLEQTGKITSQLQLPAGT